MLLKDTSISRCSTEVDWYCWYPEKRMIKGLKRSWLSSTNANASEPLTAQDRQLLEISQDTNRYYSFLTRLIYQKLIETDELPEDVIRISVLKIKTLIRLKNRSTIFFFEKAGLVEQDATYLSNARHISLIEKAVESLQAVNEGHACWLHFLRLIWHVLQ